MVTLNLGGGDIIRVLNNDALDSTVPLGTTIAEGLLPSILRQLAEAKRASIWKLGLAQAEYSLPRARNQEALSRAIDEYHDVVYTLEQVFESTAYILTSDEFREQINEAWVEMLVHDAS